MGDTILERDDQEQATSVQEETKSAETENQTEVSTETETQDTRQSEETVKEAEVEVDGQRYTATQIKEALQAAKNKTEWQKTNTLRSEELARQKRELEQAVAVQTILKQNPERLQKFLAPEPERDFDAELKGHYAKRPAEYGDEYIRWEFDRDKLVTEKATSQAFRQAQAQESKRAAEEHNVSLANSAYEKYHEKVSDEEFQQMAGWFVQNIQPRNGKFPDNSFDVAYKFLYGDRDMETAKLSAAKAVSEQMRKAKPASGEPGKLKDTKTSQPGDEEDDAFVNSVHERYKPLSK